MRAVASAFVAGVLAAVVVLSVIACRDEASVGEAAIGGPSGAAGAAGDASARRENVVLDLWAEGQTAFGVYVADERPRGEGGRGRGRGGPRPAPVYTREGGERLASNPLYDFVFLNLEGAYDAAAVRAIAEGLRAPGTAGRKTLLVRIPPISRDGEEETRARVREVLAAGADGVVLPHVRTPEEARVAIGFFEAAGADVWSPGNPSGEIIAMLMVEDPEAVARAAEFADIPGYSVLACGIGSLRAALDGDREAAEAGNQRVLAEAKRARLADMITASAADVEQRVREGFLALLMQGPSADEVITLGRAAAGR